MTAPQFMPTDPVQVEHFAPDHRTLKVTAFWRNALYLCCNGDGFHCVRYADGQIQVLNDQTRIRKYQPNDVAAIEQVEHLTALMEVRIRQRDAAREGCREFASFVDQTHDQHRAIRKLCQPVANMGVNPETHALANRVLAVFDPDGSHAAVVATHPGGPEGKVADLFSDKDALNDARAFRNYLPAAAERHRMEAKLLDFYGNASTAVVIAKAFFAGIVHAFQLRQPWLDNVAAIEKAMAVEPFPLPPASDHSLAALINEQ